MQQQQTKRSIRTDYLQGDARLKAFYQYSVNDPDFLQIIRDKQNQPIDRNLLVSVLRDQHKNLALSRLQSQHLSLLEQENTFTITTGHQLVLFGGPLFTVYKVLSVITLAQQLSEKFTDYHFVPIFWIHTEDHDFKEINHYYTHFERRHTYNAAFKGKVGNHVLTKSIESLIPSNFPQSLQHTYQSGKKMSEAFREFFHELFSTYGLLILDPDRLKLKSMFQRTLQEELVSQTSQQLISATSQRMVSCGYPLQITSREINLFYMDETVRNRITHQNGHYRVLDTSMHYSKDEILTLVENRPNLFSPNVSLRPLYQETILPNLAYVGGWGELSYWLQLKEVFEHYGVNFPLLLPRMSATIFSSDQAEEWQSLGFRLEDVNELLYELYRRYIPKVWEDGEYVRLSDQILQAFDDLDHYINNISQTLPRTIRGQRVKNERFMINLRKKIHRVIRHKFPSYFEQIKDLKQTIQPDRTKQERVLSLMAFQHIEPQEFIRIVASSCTPLDFSPSYIIIPSVS